MRDLQEYEGVIVGFDPANLAIAIGDRVFHAGATLFANIHRNYSMGDRVHVQYKRPNLLQSVAMVKKAGT